MQAAKSYENLPFLQPSVSKPRKPPNSKPRSITVDKIDKLTKNDEIKDFNDVDESLLKYLYGYTRQKYEDHVVYFKLEVD